MGTLVRNERQAVAVASCPVNSHNEWDPLEEVIVGGLEGATIPDSHPVTTHNVPRAAAKLLKIFGGWHYPRLMVKRAQKQLDAFIRLLEAEGVTVRRPEVRDHRPKYRIPGWSARGHMASCPRDGFMVVGDEIIEAPMSWRCRYFEGFAYRSLFKRYFAEGAKWTSAPKPELADHLYDYDYVPPEEGEPMRYVTSEFEPVFDAADFVRCGRDLFVIRSNVTNRSGIEWMRRHLSPEYKIHEIESRCRHPMHIDSSFMPLAPGKVLINPQFIDIARLPSILDSWDILVAPEPDPVSGSITAASMCSEWINVNVLVLDEKRIVCEKGQPSMIQALKKWGFEPIPCDFLEYSTFGGSFHCATLDVRRRGELQSYF
ncbi:MAG: amidinotransferase [Gammaproteobacteria bacterium]|nr:amidinotransferase [Gammaproteobacteria bacterium]NIR84809.1 amidinotransferase [Gammaproteobacteria bacterium]NIR91523.1 amidinotransferase [Gammaproteobacteria bacterium]NIU05856.1 amidinotransferase [Gammaproteobacteria bacterium]NIV76711.1 amidinotransferase [Gammaproteobacteria bacterium]